MDRTSNRTRGTPVMSRGILVLSRGTPILAGVPTSRTWDSTLDRTSHRTRGTPVMSRGYPSPVKGTQSWLGVHHHTQGNPSLCGGYTGPGWGHRTCVLSPGGGYPSPVQGNPSLCVCVGGYLSPVQGVPWFWLQSQDSCVLSPGGRGNPVLTRWTPGGVGVPQSCPGVPWSW